MRSMAMPRTVNIVLVSLFYAAVSVAILFNKAMSAYFLLPLPIALNKGFPIPVFFWMGGFIYVLALAHIRKKDSMLFIRAFFVIGALIHLLLSLVKLKIGIMGAALGFSTGFYRLYCEAFVFLCFSALAVFSAKKIVDWRTAVNVKAERAIEEDALLFPLVMIFIMIIGIFFVNGAARYAACLAGIFLVSIPVFLDKAGSGFIADRMRAVKEFFLRERVFLCALFITAVAVRSFYLLNIMRNPDFFNTGSDATLYDGLARSLAAGQKVTEPLVTGYWMFLALVYKVFGTSYFVVGFIQVILSALSSIFVYFSAKYIFNGVVARIAGILSVLSFTAIFSSVAIGHQVMDTFYSTLGLLLLSRYAYRRVQKGKVPFSLLALIGLVLGLSIVTREINLFYPIFVVLWIVPVMGKKAGFKKVIGDCAAIILCTGLALTPFIVRNVMNLGVAYPVFEVKGADYSITGHYLKGENPVLSKLGLDLSDPGRVGAALLKHPVSVTGVFLKNFYDKFIMLYFSQGYGGFDMVFLSRVSDYYYTAWFYVYVLTLAGIINAFARYGFGAHLIALIFIMNRTLVHIITESGYRHRAPIDPYLILYFAFGVYSLVSAARRRVLHA
jgi:hypothetical protein